VSFLFRTAILCRNAHGIWYLVAGRQKLQGHWQSPPLVSAVVLPIKSSRRICTKSSCAKNARNVASALRPLPGMSRKSLLLITELLQSLGNGHANEREPQRNRSQQRKIKKNAYAPLRLTQPPLQRRLRDQCWNRVTMLDREPRRSRHSLAATPKTPLHAVG
jgi:hypothetical protein